MDAGLKYVHNDICYPALLVIGQFLDALERPLRPAQGRADDHADRRRLPRVQLIHLLRKALAKAGYSYVPVISLSMTGLEKN